LGSTTKPTLGENKTKYKKPCTVPQTKRGEGGEPRNTPATPNPPPKVVSGGGGAGSVPKETGEAANNTKKPRTTGKNPPNPGFRTTPRGVMFRSPKNTPPKGPTKGEEHNRKKNTNKPHKNQGGAGVCGESVKPTRIQKRTQTDPNTGVGTRGCVGGGGFWRKKDSLPPPPTKKGVWAKTDMDGKHPENPIQGTKEKTKDPPMGEQKHP